MPNIGRMIIDNESPDSIRDAIMTSLYSKAAERVDAIKPLVASNLFNEDPDEEYEDEEYEDEEYEDEEYEDEE